MTAEAVPQHMEALERANVVRLARAALKRQLKADPPLHAPLRVAALLCQDERVDAIDTMPMAALLAAIPRFGRARILKLLENAGVPERKLVGSATPRQRQAVADALDAAVRDRLARHERMAFERQLRAERVG